MSAKTPRPDNYETSKTVFVKLNAIEDTLLLLTNTADFLMNYLNRGSFEGVTGAQPSVVMRLDLACDLLFIIAYSRNKEGRSALCELFSASQKKGRGPAIDVKRPISRLITWLFLNGREDKNNLTPATQKALFITELIKEILNTVGDYEHVIKGALKHLMETMENVSAEVLFLSEEARINADVAVKLSARSCALFSTFINNWLISDSVASTFAFDLNGFEFLLDRISIGKA